MTTAGRKRRGKSQDLYNGGYRLGCSRKLFSLSWAGCGSVPEINP
jgi:hypothetical protein